LITHNNFLSFKLFPEIPDNIENLVGLRNEDIIFRVINSSEEIVKLGLLLLSLLLEAI